MAGLDFDGILLPSQLETYTYQDILWFIQEYYVNQTPFMARVNREPVNAPTFDVRHYKYRPSNYTFAGSVTTGTDFNNTDTFTVVVIANVTSRGDSPTNPLGTGDTTTLMVGDVLNIDSERVEVIATPATEVGAQPSLSAFGSGLSIPAAGTILVRRGAEGTTVATHTHGTVATLISNSATGGEIFRTGIYATPIIQTQYVQTWEYACQVGGGVMAMNAYGQQPGSAFEIQKKQQLDNMMRDKERSSIMGKGEAYSATNLRQKQIGVMNQIVTNRVTSPTNASGYLPADFEQDVLQPLWQMGSAPNLIICGVDFLRGLTTWSTHALRIEVPTTTYGVAIETYTSNLFPGGMIIPDPYMPLGSIYCGMEELLFWRVLEGENFIPRMKRGDATEGEWISRGAIEVRDEQKHVFLTGITGYATP